MLHYFSIVVLFLALLVSPLWAAVDLVVDGRPKAKIYLSGPLAKQVPYTVQAVTVPIPDDVARALAARELVEHVQKMSGAELPVVLTDDPAAIPADEPAIVVGALAVKLGAVPRETTVTDEGYRILAKGQRLLIGGQSERAALFGVYDLLERLGCAWVMPGELGQVVPKSSTVRVEEMDYATAPGFLGRALVSDIPKEKPPVVTANVQWLWRQRGGNRQFPASGAAGHYWPALIRRHRAEFDKDPAMYALVKKPDGRLVREGPQIETTHPRVIQLFIEDIKETYRKNIAAGTWTKDTPAAFPIGPADGLGFSLSPQSLAAGSGVMDAMNGELDRTDEIILLGNRILAEVHKEYPNAQVGFYIYSVHGEFPHRYTPDKDIVAIFAPISFSRVHSALDPISKGQNYYRPVVERWAELSKKQGNPLIFRGYNFNLAEGLVPFDKSHIWGEELPWYHKLGFRGLNVEGFKAWSLHGPGDYVFMKLAWDPSLDWKAVLADYYRKAYGDGAASMEKYFLGQMQRQRDAGQEAGSFFAIPLIYDLEWVSQGRTLLEQAKAAAKDPKEKERIDLVGGGLRMLELFLQQHHAATRFDFTAAQQIADTLLAEHQQQYDRHPELISRSGTRYFRRFLSAFIAEGKAYSTGDYRLALALPDQLKTAFDPNQAGVRMGFYRPQIHDDKWLQTRTYSSTWDEQGLDRLRPGAVWYRWEFDLSQLPAEQRHQPLGLFLGGIDDTARVWLNGQLIGQSPSSFSKPFVFDLSDAVKKEGKNLLAIEISRWVPTNELGTGGLLRPSFLFTGPRLASKAPMAPTTQPRFLPGAGE